MGPRKRYAAVIALVLIAATACSSSSSGGSAGGTPKAYKLGLIGPLTGVRADVGSGMVSGAKLAITEINANGGVLGHQLSLVQQDDAGDPGDAVPAAQKELQSDHITAMVGPTALTEAVVLPLIDRANIPDLMWGGGGEFDKVTDPHFFRMTPSDTEQADAMAVFAQSKGWKRVSLAIGSASADQSLLPALKTATAKLGISIVSQVTVTIGSTSFRSEIQRLYANKPDAILAQFDIPSAGILFGEVAQEGLSSTPWVASNLWYSTEFVKSVGKAVTGPIYIANPGSTNVVGPSQFLAILKAQTGASAPRNGQEAMYDAVTTWALGADVAGTTSWPKIGAGIIKASNGPGTACGDYPTCYTMIKAGTAINWDGSGSTVDFDKYHNVFGPFDVLHYNANGSTTSVTTITSTDVINALGNS
jgi:branched-chain amino acid transport system substrate-binding protein